jgi:hypothetical protein
MKSTLQPIGIKKVLDEAGDFHHLELWQGQNVIRISFRSRSLDSVTATYKWDNLREMIEKILKQERGEQ